jgi:hypothetical protein
LTIANNAAVNTGVPTSLNILISSPLDIYPELEILGSSGNSHFSFWKSLHSVFHTGYNNLHPHQQDFSILHKNLTDKMCLNYTTLKFMALFFFLDQNYEFLSSSLRTYASSLNEIYLMSSFYFIRLFLLHTNANKFSSSREIWVINNDNKSRKYLKLHHITF